MNPPPSYTPSDNIQKSEAIPAYNQAPPGYNPAAYNQAAYNQSAYNQAAYNQSAYGQSGAPVTATVVGTVNSMPPPQGGFMSTPTYGTPAVQTVMTPGGAMVVPSTVTAIQPVIVQQQRLYSRGPQFYVCPYCGFNAMTTCSYESGTGTWLWCAGLCLFGCNLGCCFIPFCVDGTKDCIHKCGNCHRVLGRINQI